MSDPSLPLQKTIVGAMKGVSPSIAGGRIYDQVPTSPTFPYVSLGSCQVLPDKAECIDGSIVYPIIDVWSRAVGYPELKAIVQQILSVLDDQPLLVDGFQLVVFAYEDVQYLRDPDGQTNHAAITFRGLLNPL